MTIHLAPETQRLVQEEIGSGHFGSLDEIIIEGIRAWREKHGRGEAGLERSQDAVERALEFAKTKAIPLDGISIKELIHEGHRL